MPGMPFPISLSWLQCSRKCGYFEAKLSLLNINEIAEATDLVGGPWSREPSRPQVLYQYFSLGFGHVNDFHEWHCTKVALVTHILEAQNSTDQADALGRQRSKDAGVHSTGSVKFASYLGLVLWDLLQDLWAALVWDRRAIGGGGGSPSLTLHTFPSLAIRYTA